MFLSQITQFVKSKAGFQFRLYAAIVLCICTSLLIPAIQEWQIRRKIAKVYIVGDIAKQKASTIYLKSGHWPNPGELKQTVQSELPNHDLSVLDFELGKIALSIQPTVKQMPTKITFIPTITAHTLNWKCSTEPAVIPYYPPSCQP